MISDTVPDIEEPITAAEMNAMIDELITAGLTAPHYRRVRDLDERREYVASLYAGCSATTRDYAVSATTTPGTHLSFGAADLASWVQAFGLTVSTEVRVGDDGYVYRTLTAEGSVAGWDVRLVAHTSDRRPCSPGRPGTKTARRRAAATVGRLV